MKKLSKEQQNKYLSSLNELLSIPSISTLPEHKGDMKKAVAYLSSYLKKIGFNTINTLWAKKSSKTKNYPVVFAEKISNPDNPTILIYGHYDVQPADPLGEWRTPPFQPTIKAGSIYARGSTDDKGQLFTHLAALDWLSNDEWGEDWPVNIKLLLEGEEESGGENIEWLVKEHAATGKFDADVCLISDTGFVDSQSPTIEYALRGIVYAQIDVKLSDNDLHSGLYGGSVLNPANALSYIISKLYDATTGKILIPGIYNGVKKLGKKEKNDLSKIPFEANTYLKDAGNAKALFGENGFTTTERTTARPSLDINGIWGGFIGAGAKTIIPATAHAKISIRTVENQNPKEIAELLESYIKKISPKGVEVSIKVIHTGDGVSVNLNSKWMKIVSESLQEVFDNEVVFSRSGGSIPVAALIQNILKIDPILVGYGLPDDGLHAPNEKFSLNQFFKGIECNRLIYQTIAKL